MTPTSSLKRRLAAAAYELLPILAIVIGVGIAFVGIAQLIGLSTAKLPRPYRIALFCAWYGALAVYFVWSWRRGQTLPMKAWRLRVESAGPHAPSLAALGLRFALASFGWGFAAIGAMWLRENPRSIVAWAALAPLLICLAWALLDRDRQALYDRLARTRLVVLPRPG